MTKMVTSLAGALLMAAALGVTPAAATAQCHWGCRCEANSCGCNRNGSGSSCDNGGTGCVVTACDMQVTQVEFAPDGSVARFASVTSRDSASDGAALIRMESPGAMAAALGGSFRWEYLADGRSVARHCSGLILARYYAPETAAALREQTRTLSI